MLTLLDTSAWIELFIRGPNWHRVEEVLKGDECYTSILSVAEVANWAAKQNINPSIPIDIMEATTTMLDLDSQTARLAGLINFERKKLVKKWGMLDSLIFATAMSHGLKVLAKDSDFHGLAGVEII